MSLYYKQTYLLSVRIGETTISNVPKESIIMIIKRYYWKILERLHMFWYSQHFFNILRFYPSQTTKFITNYKAFRHMYTKLPTTIKRPHSRFETDLQPTIIIIEKMPSLQSWKLLSFTFLHLSLTIFIFFFIQKTLNNLYFTYLHIRHTPHMICNNKMRFLFQFCFDSFFI